MAETYYVVMEKTSSYFFQFLDAKQHPLPITNVEIRVLSCDEKEMSWRFETDTIVFNKDGEADPEKFSIKHEVTIPEKASMFRVYVYESEAMETTFTLCYASEDNTITADTDLSGGEKTIVLPPH